MDGRTHEQYLYRQVSNGHEYITLWTHRDTVTDSVYITENGTAHTMRGDIGQLTRNVVQFLTTECTPAWVAE